MPKDDNVFSEALRQTLGFEGGVDKNEVGRSGISNLGITQRALDAFRRKRNLAPKRVEELSVKEAAQIYKEDFFEGPKINKLPADVAKAVFDFGVNAGPGTAIRALQRSVGSKPDGVIGPKTLTAVAGQDSNALINSILDEREILSRSLAQQRPEVYGKFLKGWINRIEAQRPKR